MNADILDEDVGHIGWMQRLDAKRMDAGVGCR